MRLGDTFWFQNLGSPKPHLWVVVFISSNESIVAFNLVTDRPTEPFPCLIQKKEYEVLSHDSYVYYRGGTIYAKAQAQGFLDSGEWSTDKRMNDAVVERILRGAMDSQRTPGPVREFLRSNGVRGSTVVIKRPRRPRTRPPED